jgi:methyl-accepting chemotaxis protein
MAEKHLLILERSAQNLQKITRNGKTMLEGVFAEFGVENRNGRIYEEKEYLPHLEYLKKDITNGNLLGELDHPERFEVALGGVSHRISELWYDQQKRQVLGRLEILDTPKGQIAKSLLEAGVPLSISSRAAGTVNEDKTVAIQQIYTYDLVAKPGFESAQLHAVNESANPKQKFINELVKQLNESSTSRKDHSINSKFGIINENISIIDVTDKFPSVPLREEALKLIKNNTENQMAETKPTMSEDAIQQWTELFTKELGVIKEDLSKLKESGTAGESGELTKLKEYVEKIRKIQEDSLNWSSEIAKAVNEVATYADTLAEKSNKHYTLTKKIAETVDYNAKTLNATQDWTSKIAETTNAIGETVDHNAEMLDGLNEWTTQIAKGVNSLNEWNEEIAPAVNGMHEWTSSIAKNLNHSVNWTEDMFGRAISKEDATKLVEYIELVAESKQNPELKSKIDEMLKTHSITAKPLNEANLKGIAVIDSVGRVGNVKVDTSNKELSDVKFDEKTKTIEAGKIKTVKVGKEKLPVGDAKLQMDPDKAGSEVPKNQVCCNEPKDHKTGLQVTQSIKVNKDNGADGPTKAAIKDQNLKLNEKPGKKGFTNEELNKTSDIQTRKSILDEKLSKIVEALEKEKSVDEEVKSQYPFTNLLSDSDRKRFVNLDATDKQKVASEITKVPTTDSKVIVKLWENALAKNKVEEPLWLTLAPKSYKEAFNKASTQLKETISARAEFYTLNTQYQIDNFWETSGVIVKPVFTLNESVVVPKTTEEDEQKSDTLVASVGEYMKNRYSM